MIERPCEVMGSCSILTEENFSGASDSDSEAELRRRKQQRLRQKRQVRLPPISMSVDPDCLPGCF